MRASQSLSLRATHPAAPSAPMASNGNHTGDDRYTFTQSDPAPVKLTRAMSPSTHARISPRTLPAVGFNVRTLQPAGAEGNT